jgi:hypothetical protein
MVQADLEKGGGLARDPLQERERFENKKLYRRGGCVGKLTLAVSAYL